MAEQTPEDFEQDTYWHPNHEPCPKTGDTTPVILNVPVDKTGWSGAACGQCGQQLQAF